MHVNILLVDPYYEDIQIYLIKSSRYFAAEENPIKDIVIKSIMYKSATDVKMIQ